jgi:arylsulfatase A-like enzyme
VTGRLRVLLSLACVLPASMSCKTPRPPDIVVITVDTLRADHVGAYDPRASTPRIDAFASGATVFERSTAPMPLTRPSHFSLLTSLYPREHGVMNNAMALPDTARTLTEMLDEGGYRTGGFVAVRLLGPDSGADQGFDHFEQPEARESVAADVVSHALSWVDGLDGSEPFFLWVHLFDPHLPYDPPAEYRGGVPADRPRIDCSFLMDVAGRNDGDVPAEILEEGKTLYRGEVSYVDHWIGELLDGLDARRAQDETLVVFTADHGECFENGVFFEHADCLWEPGVHIPLIVRYPPEFPAGRRVAEPTTILDVAPTVLRAAGLEVPDGLSGRALQDHGRFGDRTILLQYPFYQPSAADRRPQRLDVVRSVAGEPTTPILLGVERVGLVDRQWKYLRSGETQALYSLAPTVDERNDKIAEFPEIAERMRRLLEQQLQSHPLVLLDAPEINEELLETLRALGYL